MPTSEADPIRLPDLLEGVDARYVMGWCTNCCVGSPMEEWKQEGDGWTCPDCGANVPRPVSAEEVRPMLSW